DVDKAVEGAQTAFNIESPWHKLDPLSFSEHKPIYRKLKHLTMLIALKPIEQTPLSALYCAALIKEMMYVPECVYAIAVHAHIDKVACTSPVEFGVKSECDGERVDNKGYFIKATIFSDVKDDMQIAHEEIFGPVMSVLKYDSYEEGIKRANDTTFGVGAGVITKDIRRGLTLAHQIRPGSMWINTYKTICDQALFDGFKESGQERELGRYGLEAYYKVKTIVVKLV
ncbi:unnamed protein product, partial [Rotaria sordida]